MRGRVRGACRGRAAVAWLCHACVLAALLASGDTLTCWQCGEYSDGVGSITPCLDTGTLRLRECTHTDTHCIKYVSELTTVRDCTASCSERESWGARSHCCDTDGCNRAPPRAPAPRTLLLLLVSAAAAASAAFCSSF